MKRRLLQLCFALGLLLTLAAGVLTVRGFWATDSFQIVINRETNGSHAFEDVRLASGCSCFWFVWRRFAATVPSDPPHDAITASHLADTPQPLKFFWRNETSSWQRLGFAYDFRHPQIGGIYIGVHRELVLPSWFALLICAFFTAFPAQRLWRDRRRRRRRERNLCPTCGYDLRGADHARCPECGAGVTSQPV